MLATPFLRELRRCAPNAQIALVTGPAGASFAAACPHVDERAVLPPEPGPRRLGDIRRVFRFARFLDQHLTPEAFDIAVIPRTGADLRHGRLLAYLSGATVRAGYATESPPIPATADLTLALRYPATPIHEVEANLLLLESLGGEVRSRALELHCSPEDRRAIALRLAAGPTPTAPLLVLGVGASLPHKIWPAAHYARLAEEFLARDWRVVLVGDREDRRRFSGLAVPWLDYTGELTPLQTYALLGHAALFVGNDSGPAHLAAAASCPCVIVSWDRPGSDPRDVNSPRRFHPYGVPHALVHCQQADGRCDATLVAFADVLAAALSLPSRPVTTSPA